MWLSVMQMIAVKSFNMRQKIILKLMGDGKFKVIVIKKKDMLA